MSPAGPEPGPVDAAQAPEPPDQPILPAAHVRVLEDRVINQIAAGEVVERPASVVKELVENALDARARHLRITLRGGGRDLVQVEDDGHGMARQDAMLCIERHATSKISRSEDLASVRTLGFRGEALPSIAAVSRFELLTRRASDDVGTRVVVDGGRMVDVRDAGCPPGTRITVRGLFSNLPARRKFLRTVATELSHCQDAVIRETLIRPRVGVELFHEGRPLVRAVGGATSIERAVAMLGRDAEQLVSLSWQDDVAGGISVRGLVSPPGVHRGSARGALWLYVNGRAVRDPLLRRAVLDAFRGLVPKGRYPTVVLDLVMPPEEVDVNVHPAKTEVRFRDGRDVSRAISEGLRGALGEQGIRARALQQSRRGVGPTRPQAPLAQVVLPGVGPGPVLQPQGRAGEPATPPPPDRVAEERQRWPTAQRPPEPPPPEPPPPEPPLPADRHPSPMTPAPQQERDRSPRLVGQADGRWLVCERGGEVLLVDRQRAHTRILEARLREGPAARPLLAPLLVELPTAQVAAAVDRQAMLASLGVELEDFGGDTLRLRALPEPCASAPPEPLVRALAAALADGAGVDAVRWLLASHAAVAPGAPLSPYEQRSLLAAVDLDAPGVAVRLSPDELRRRLDRA